MITRMTSQQSWTSALIGASLAEIHRISRFGDGLAVIWAESNEFCDYHDKPADCRGCPDTSVGLADDPAAVERFRAIESLCGRIDHSI